MDVRIAQPLGYSEPGGRPNNEDSIFPDPRHVSPQQKWFMVCDGVGGAERGEVASRLAVVSLDTFLQLHPTPVVTPAYVQEAIAYAEEQFNAYLHDNEQAAGMATTLTLLSFHEAGALIAHIGDSRVYHVRNGQIIWRTDDHSYVAELVKSGVLTPEEAYRHPQRNVITKALQGGTKPIQASIHTTDDLQPGDYFFLCSDGVLERINDALLGSILVNPAESNEQKLARLRLCSVGNTRDNFTAYLIQVEQVIGTTQSATPAPLSAYSSYDHNRDDDDEAITLINVPVPDDVRNDAPPAEPVRPPVVADSRQATPTRPECPAVALPPRSDDRPTVPSRQSSGRWSIMLVGIVGALIGIGGFLGWQWLNGRQTNAPAAGEPAAVSTITAEPPATDARPASAGQQTSQQSDDRPHTNASTGDGTMPGLSLRSDRHAPAGGSAGSYEVVRQIDSKLLVVRDSQTKRLGLQKSNGDAITERVYTGIGSFKNGVADVDSDNEQARYLAKDGTTFSAFGNYKDGVATLTDLNGRAHYLSQGGKWLDEVRPASNGKVAVCRNKRWGYLNMQGQVAIFLQYDRAESFGDDGTAEVSLNGKTFRIDKKGDRVAGEPGKADERDEKKGRQLSRRDA